MSKATQDIRDKGGWWLGQARGLGGGLPLQGVLSFSLVLLCPLVDNPGV